MKHGERDKSIGYLVWKLSNAARAELEGHLSEIDLTPCQMGALCSLHDESSHSTADLAREVLMTPQNMSQVVSKLEREGHVERHPHETNRRIHKLLLTKSGRGAMEQAITRAHRVDARMTAELSPNERATLASLLQRCLRSMAAGDVRLPSRSEHRTARTKKRTAAASRTKRG
jgi:DNA-binding MarR family transcriptional regulator